MKGVIQDDQAARRIIEKELNITISEPFSGLVFFDGTRAIGAAIFNKYDKWDVEFTCVLFEDNLGMRIARQVAWYVFGVMKCHRCTAITMKSNIKAQTALKKIGFQFEGIMREHFPDREDGLVYGILRHEQRLMRHL